MISDGSNFVDSTWAKPRGASMPRFELVKFFSASSADIRPFFAALPGWNGLHIVPNISRRPEDWVAAIPSAQTICCSFRPSSLPQAAAAPITPAVPVMCQPVS